MYFGAKARASKRVSECGLRERILFARAASQQHLEWVLCEGPCGLLGGDGRRFCREGEVVSKVDGLGIGKRDIEGID